jgi:hypothetical protein
MSVLTTHTYSNPREKQKKRNEQKKLQQAIESQRERSLEEDKSRTPKARATPRHIRDKTMLKQRAQTTKPKLEKPQRAPPAHMQAPPEPMHPPWMNAYKPLEENRAAASAQLRPVRPVDTTGQTGAQHVNRASTLTGQTGDSNRSDWCTTEPRNGSKPPENLLNAISSPKQTQSSLPC